MMSARSPRMVAHTLFGNSGRGEERYEPDTALPREKEMALDTLGADAGSIGDGIELRR